MAAGQRKAAETDQSGHAAFETTQYVTSTLRVRNIALKTDEAVLLELFSQVSIFCPFKTPRRAACTAVPV